MFRTGHDEANRATVKRARPEEMKVVGLALREDKKVVDAREGHNWGSSPSRISSFASCTGILNVNPAASLTHEEAARYGRDVSRTVDER
jgi:hypothetical protein